MVLGQRGRQPPQGKVESNPSITDLSFTAQAETKWGSLCMDSLLLHRVDMNNLHRQNRHYILGV